MIRKGTAISMKKQKGIGKKTTRTAALFLAVLMFMTTLMGSDVVLAYKSLDHIESIKQEKTTSGLPFTIVEIVPYGAKNGMGYGSMGYYIKDQEPTAAWRSAAAALTGAQARADYANGVFQKLRGLGLLGDAGTTPLQSAGDYREQMPWETPVQNAQTLNLVDGGGAKREEETQLHAKFTYQGKNQGVFDQNSDPTLAVDENGQGLGTANQSIQYFSYETATQNGLYYYAPTFAKLDLDNHSPSDYKGQAMYLLSPVDAQQPDGPKKYQYVGILGKDLTLDLSQTYYRVETTGRPYDQRSDTACYSAQADGFEEVANGYFAMKANSYVYAGQGQGDYSMTLSESEPAMPVRYSSVQISGGYTNAQWFLGKVFDQADTPVKVKVFSLTPAEVTDNMLQNADMLVVSAGYDWENGGAEMMKGYEQNLLSADQANLIVQAAADKRPVLIDARLQNSNQAVMSQLAQTLGGGKTQSLIDDSVYSFWPDAQRQQLATAQFGLPFASSLWSTEGTPYYAVMKEIEYENFLRTRAQMTADEKLPEEVTMAGCLRYIINFKGQRVENAKTEIRVLEIEPQTQGSELKGNESKVLEWLPSDSGLTAANIHVTVMSTAEFIAKIEDINEQYDMVYLGASTSGFNTETENGKPVAVYNDPSMRGLLYSNIGDRYYSNLKLSGLVDADYSGSSWFTIPSFYNGATTRDFSAARINSAVSEYRFSGNDITDRKKQELQNFANSGFPIILSDDLVRPGQPERKETTLSVTITGSIQSGILNLSAQASTEPALAGTISYQWYLGNSPISGATSQTYRAYATATGVYTCKATLEVDAGYVATSNRVTVTQQGSNVEISDTTYSWANQYPFRVSGTTDWWDSTKYTVSYDNIWSTTPAYQWEQLKGNAWKTVKNATGAELTVGDNGGTYRCRVTVGRKTYYTQAITRQSGYWGWSHPTRDVTDTTKYAFSVSQVASGGSVALTAKMTPEANYRYYVNNSNDAAAVGASHTLTAQNGSYYWQVTDQNGNYILYYSETYTVTAGYAAQVGTSRVEDAVIPRREPTDYAVDPDRIDSSSVLYETMTGILPQINVMPAAEAKAQKSTVLKYLNLSKPSLVMTNKPAEYTGDSQLSASLVDRQTLSFGFRIENPTDSTPSSTRYTCHLYIDLNADGRYAASEELTDLLIRDETAGKKITPSELRDKTAYSITRVLPDNFAGIIPWKVEVVKVGSDQIHASQQGYTYIKPPKATELKILQITYGDFTLEGNTKYHGLFDSLRSKGIYDIKVTTQPIKHFDSMSKAAVDAEFSQYNMLILGFGDGYGYGQSWGGLSLNASNAVVDYIDSGKAVLFTHDNTSYVNLPVRNYQTTTGNSNIYGGQWHWGYYFNSVIRDAVGLDRYGVTNRQYGITAYSPLPQKGGLVAGGYSGFNSTTAQTLKDAGYSIAYQPKTEKAGTLYSTQGFTSLTMLRFSNAKNQKTMNSGISVNTNDDGNLVESAYATTTVSQTNQGQITTFPYNLNQTRMSVASTHEQYYQLNMNSDDTVVWYCLAGGTYDKMKNDAVNGYYIYNKGNVTYSGAGHSPGDVTDAEAQLFVNTMIAAYRAGAEAAKVEFKSQSGNTINASYFPAEYKSTDTFAGTILAGDDLKSEERAVSFVITDPNLSSSKSVSVKFYYENAYDEAVALSDKFTTNASEVKNFQLYLADGTPVEDRNLSSNTVYKIYLPQSVLDAFGESEKGTMNFYVQVNTAIGTKTYSGYAAMELRKLGLLPLK